MDSTVRTRFEVKMGKPTKKGCRNWLAYRSPNGYGLFHAEYGRTIVAHRQSYLLHVGPIPDGYEIDHLCNNRACVEPSHLEAVSLQENRKRRDTPSGKKHWNGKKTHCKNGHTFVGANLTVDINGSRICVTCRRAYQREYQRARRS